MRRQLSAQKGDSADDLHSAIPSAGRCGIGDSLEQVTAFTPTVANLQGYAEAVREKTLACLNTLTPADLDRDLPPPGGGDARKVGAWLSVILLDHLHHSGQVCYIRGYLTGKGWFPR